MRRSGGPAIRIERTSVKRFCLGLVGFDHLQLVYDPRGCGLSLQDDWYVIEGVRDSGPNGPILGVQGADGRLTLARANVASGYALVDRLGTPRSRGSRIVVAGQEAERLWPQFASCAGHIDRLRLPYVACALPGMQQPTCNSSSVIATLLHRLGFDIATNMPAGTRFIPGIETSSVYPAPALFAAPLTASRCKARLAPHDQACQTSVVECKRVWQGHGARPHPDAVDGAVRGVAGCCR